MEAAIRAEQRDAWSVGKFDPLQQEVYAEKDAILRNPELRPRRGDVLIDRKIRPCGYVAPIHRYRPIHVDPRRR